MIQHKFSIGQRVELLPGGSGNAVPPCFYTIVWCMPLTDRGCQYRAKNVSENHERVLDEVRLRPV